MIQNIEQRALPLIDEELNIGIIGLGYVGLPLAVELGKINHFKIIGFDLAHGGHLTHGSLVNFSGKIYKSYFYGVRKEDGIINYEQLEG